MRIFIIFVAICVLIGATVEAGAKIEKAKDIKTDKPKEAKKKVHKPPPPGK
jgi:hypothetical protein